MIDRIQERIAALAPRVDFTTPGGTCNLVDYGDGHGAVIGYWNSALLGPQPTEAQLLAVRLPDTTAAELAKLLETVEKFLDSKDLAAIALNASIAEQNARLDALLALLEAPGSSRSAFAAMRRDAKAEKKAVKDRIKAGGA